ncbi:hypothetical protein [Pseudomonas sp. Marseille-QA0892]
MEYVWEACSAISTAAAVVVALWLAQKSDRKQAKADKHKAQLTAARLIEKVRFLSDQFRLTHAGMAFYVDAHSGSDNLVPERLTRIGGHALLISNDELHSLSPLPGNCANRLAMALGIAEALHGEVNDLLSRIMWSDLSSGQRTAHVERWGSMCSRGSDFCITALRELEVASSEVAPRPSAEEIHGID